MQHKKQLTTALIEELTINIDISEAIIAWWWPGSSMRLTSEGLVIFKKVFDSIEFPYEFKFTGCNFIQLTFFKTPYFITPEKIIIFDKKLATMIVLYPNFARYVELMNEKK